MSHQNQFFQIGSLSRQARKQNGDVATGLLLSSRVLPPYEASSSDIRLHGFSPGALQPSAVSRDKSSRI